MKSNWSNSQGPLGGSGLHSFVWPGLPWLVVAHTMHVSHHLLMSDAILIVWCRCHFSNTTLGGALSTLRPK